MAGLRLRLLLLAVVSWLLASPAFSETADPAAYAGTAACAECHAAEAEAWKDSDHAWALKEPTPDSMLGDFNDATLHA